MTMCKGWPRLLHAQGADASDVRYATGFAAPDPFLLLVKGEIGRAHV